MRRHDDRRVGIPTMCMMVAAASLLLGACSSGSPGDSGDAGGSGSIVGSCTDVVKASCGGNGSNGGCTYCTDYSGTLVTTSSAKEACTATNGIAGNTNTYSSSPCPTADRVGSCVSGISNSASINVVRYYSPGFSNSTNPPKGTQSAQASCTEVDGKYTAN
jgi:hypothetical protein